MLLPELQRLAGELGISGTGRMRKGDLVAAISARQVGGGSAATGTPTDDARANGAPPADGAPAARGVAATAAPLEAPISGGANSGPLTGAGDAAEGRTRPARSRRGASRPAGSPSADVAHAAEATTEATTEGTTEATTEAEAASSSATPAPADAAPADGDQRTDGEPRTEGDRPQRNRDRNRNRGDRDGAP